MQLTTLPVLGQDSLFDSGNRPSLKRATLINTPIRLLTDACFFPVGMGYIATILNRAKWPIEILDFNLSRPTEDEAARQIQESEADYVLITGMAIQIGLMRDYARIAKRVLPECTVITGGRANAIPDFLLSVPEVDYAVMYDGEETIVELLAALEEGVDPMEVPVKGIAVWRNGQVEQTETRCFEKDLDLFGPIDYSLWDLDQYIENQMNEHAHRGADLRVRSFNMITTRGCPFRCSFCGEDKDALRRRSITSTFDEIDDLVARHGVEHFHFSDGLFVHNRKRAIAFCDEWDRRGETFTWSGNGRVDIVNEDLLIRIKESGCNWLGYGFESGSPEMLKAMNKTTKVEQAANAIRIHRKHRVGISSSFIFGAPGETYRTMWESAWFMIKNQFKPSAINFMMVYPGTPDWHYAIESGAITDQAAYVESMAGEVKRSNAYSQLRPLVNMSKMNDHTYFLWGKLLQGVIRVCLVAGRAYRYFRRHGMLKTMRRSLQGGVNW